MSKTKVAFLKGRQVWVAKKAFRTKKPLSSVLDMKTG